VRPDWVIITHATRTTRSFEQRTGAEALTYVDAAVGKDLFSEIVI
jgi:hypothetical protein